MPKHLSHYDSAGHVSMVDVSGKKVTNRTAVAYGFVTLSQSVIDALPHNKKGNPLEVARIAGICAAKKTADLIPLCHPVALSHVGLDLQLEQDGVAITATASTSAQTGVEMEALTAVSVAALTVYDMTKALDKGIEIKTIHLLQKTGGKSGDYRRKGARKDR